MADCNHILFRLTKLRKCIWLVDNTEAYYCVTSQILEQYTFALHLFDEIVVYEAALSKIINMILNVKVFASQTGEVWSKLEYLTVAWNLL